MQQGFTPGKAVIHIDLEAIDINMQEFLDAQRDYVEQRGKRGLLNDFAWLPLANYTEKKILRKQTFDEFAFSYRVFVPKKYRASILQYFHCSPLDAGHQGRDTTLARIRQHFLWEGMRRQVRVFCRACKICAQSKRRAIVRSYPRSSMLTHPFDSYEIDFVGPLTPCMDFVYVLTCICRFSGWIFLRCVKEATSEAVAKFLFEDVVCSYGPFRELRSDRGSHFIAQIIIKMSEMFHFRHVRGSAYNPTSQSLIERTHRLLNEYLRSFLLQTGGRADWVQYVMPFQWAFRCHTQTGRFGLSPFQVVHGWMPSSTLHFSTGSSSEYFEKYWIERLEWLAETHDMIRERAEELIEAYVDQVKDHGIRVGDLVYVANTAFEHNTGISHRLQPLARGPFRVVETYGQAILVESMDNVAPKKSFKVNASRVIPLKDYHSEYA
ncbi:unnamed protein product [Amoebophrya sp. A25]|nr:unnamed protein product [Amoebophrya sp. A25]|eukprot:GSA25T00017088001.1